MGDKGPSGTYGAQAVWRVMRVCTQWPGEGLKSIVCVSWWSNFAQGPSLVSDENIKCLLPGTDLDWHQSWSGASQDGMGQEKSLEVSTPQDKEESHPSPW